MIYDTAKTLSFQIKLVAHRAYTLSLSLISPPLRTPKYHNIIKGKKNTEYICITSKERGRWKA